MTADVPEWVTLTDGEAVVWSGGPSSIRLVEELFSETLLVVAGLWLAIVRPAAVVGIRLPELTVVPLGLAGIGLVLVGIGVGSGLLSYLRFRAIEYLVTTDELYVKRGLLSRNVRNLRLDRVQDSGFSQSAIQRLFGYGHVRVSTAGGSGVELRFRNVDDPAEVNGLVTAQLDRARSGSA